MTDRQAQLLRFLVHHHIETAEPVGSKAVVEFGQFDVSAPTIRNEMRELEQYGYLTHPHTSAGRIPTVAGYQYYIDSVVIDQQIDAQVSQALENVKQYEDVDTNGRIKLMAKFLAERTKSTAIVTFGADSLYYSGISNLFSQPEFQQFASAANVSMIFDQCEQKIDELYERIDDVTVLLGPDNPLGAVCGLVAKRLPNDTLFMMLGPLRMPYHIIIPAIRYI